MSFNENLKKLRQARNISMGDMARILNIPYSTYQHYENENKNTEPPYKTLVKIALIFDVTLDELLKDETENLNIKKDYAYYYILPQNDAKFFTPYWIACNLHEYKCMINELQYVDSNSLIIALDGIHKQALAKAKSTYSDTYIQGLSAYCSTLFANRNNLWDTPPKKDALKGIMRKITERQAENDTTPIFENLEGE